MAKNIVMFSDGTGQEGGVGSNTNVYDLFNMILDRTERQISFYDQGLGTGWSKFGAISGSGVTKNVQEAYQFLSDHFSAGDRIYLIGFSRGAATVRTLSAFISLFGILPRSRPELFKKAWRIYKLGNCNKRREKVSEFVHQNHTMWTKIRFIGVWDTVAALGLPSKPLDLVIDKVPFWRHSFHDLTLADSVEYGRHAVAVDDERRTFHPVLWDERGPRPNGLPSDSGPALFSTTDVSDIYLVAEKLKDSEDNAVSSRLYPRLEDSTKELLAQFDCYGGRRESNKRANEMRTAVVEEFNKVIKSRYSIYDPNDESSKVKFDTLQMSTATRDCISQLTPPPLPRVVSRLNRMLLEDAYSLKPRVKQVWFAGMHSDVGGGYPENELGQIALLWMVSEAIDLGLLIYEKHTVDLKPYAAGTMHDSRSGLSRLYRRGVRQWKKEENQGRSPLVHESVTVRYAEDPLYEPWILKTDYDVEPWPERLEASIQFDDEHLWREGFWGWGAAFQVAWKDIERISHDASQRTMTIHMLTGQDIFIQGSLPRALPALVEQLERIRERKRVKKRNDVQDEQDKRLVKQGKDLKELYSKLKQRVDELGNDNRFDNGRAATLKRKANKSEDLRE